MYFKNDHWLQLLIMNVNANDVKDGRKHIPTHSANLLPFTTIEKYSDDSEKLLNIPIGINSPTTSNNNDTNNDCKIKNRKRQPKYRATKRPHSERRFQCDYCESRFFTQKDVKRHMVVHTGLRNFPCPFCSQRFGRKDHLVRHAQKSHDQDTRSLKRQRKTPSSVASTSANMVAVPDKPTSTTKSKYKLSKLSPQSGSTKIDFGPQLQQPSTSNYSTASLITTSSLNSNSNPNNENNADIYYNRDSSTSYDAYSNSINIFTTNNTTSLPPSATLVDAHVDIQFKFSRNLNPNPNINSNNNNYSNVNFDNPYPLYQNYIYASCVNDNDNSHHQHLNHFESLTQPNQPTSTGTTATVVTNYNEPQIPPQNSCTNCPNYSTNDQNSGNNNANNIKISSNVVVNHLTVNQSCCLSNESVGSHLSSNNNNNPTSRIQFISANNHLSNTLDYGGSMNASNYQSTSILEPALIDKEANYHHHHLNHTQHQHEHHQHKFI